MEFVYSNFAIIEKIISACNQACATPTERELFIKNSKLLGLDRHYQHYFGTVSLLSMYLVVFPTKHFSGLTLFNSPEKLPSMILAVKNLENSLHTSGTLSKGHTKMKDNIYPNSMLCATSIL